jgi:hypothetical protein
MSLIAHAVLKTPAAHKWQKKQKLTGNIGFRIDKKLFNKIHT